ncbi:MAG: glycerol-3-phosphate 1-O-acyltransferase PlsY [Betaproteobacteria bacterium]|nr:glycerol-3-phosphate 1-O-acyltransferase PlsY [Betaproteobacteria bacterium]MDE2357774.1 glycerol-3-phosphate 1-O-acyltransferase PlsY [Betaproteobacteria bacterium]
MLTTIVIIIGAYLIGSISFAVVVSRLYGLPDPHAYGSGNPGATNVLRTGNKVAAALTLVGDGAKGFAAVFIVQRLAPALDAAAWTVAAASLGVFLGHLYPVFHRFMGGKGVATAAGIVFAWHWPLGLALAVVWLTMAFGFRISSLAALTTAILMPLGMFYVAGPAPVAWASVAIALLLYWRHRANIRQLLSGSERPIGR